MKILIDIPEDSLENTCLVLMFKTEYIHHTIAGDRYLLDLPELKFDPDDYDLHDCDCEYCNFRDDDLFKAGELFKKLQKDREIKITNAMNYLQQRNIKYDVQDD